jgi:hypothetical protein
MSARLIESNRNRCWRNNKDGKYHRTDGPAIIWENGLQEWYNNGVLHREDGPAVIYPDRYQGWCINGRRYYTNKEFQEAASLSDEDMLLMVLKYGNVK